MIVSQELRIKAIFIALALGGIATLWAAIAADMGASLLVIFNALRLLNYSTAEHNGHGGGHGGGHR